MRPFVRRNLLSIGSVAERLFAAYKNRVLAAGGTVEAEACATAAINAIDVQGLLSTATMYLSPSGYKSGVVYSELPSNGNGDLTFTRASVATRVNSSGSIESLSSGVPAIDYSLGGCPTFLVEPQRTNWIINSEMIGATNSSLPTGTNGSSGGNSTCTCVGTGATSDGYKYIDIRFSGINATGTYVQYNMSNSTQSMCVENDVFYFSGYYQIINGGTTNINAIRNSIGIYDSTNTYRSSVYSEIKTLLSPTPTLIGGVVTIPTNASIGGYTIAKGQCYLLVTYTAGATFDITIRVYGIMCEKGSSSPSSTNYRTSYIPTTGTTATRVVATAKREGLISSGILNGSGGGTWYLNIKNNQSLKRDGFDVLALTSSTTYASANAMYLQNVSSSTANQFKINKRISGTETQLYTTSANNLKLAFVWDGANLKVYQNGVLAPIITTAFTATDMTILDSTNVGVPKYISEIAMWNTALSASQCAALTT